MPMDNFISPYNSIKSNRVSETSTPYEDIARERVFSENRYIN